MDTSPIFPGLGLQLSSVLYALQKELVLDPVWTLKQTCGKIYLDICWTKTSKTKTPATNGHNKEANCATQPQVDKQLELQRSTIASETSVDPICKQKRRERKSPSTRKRDRERREKWLSQKQRHKSISMISDNTPATPGLPTRDPGIDTTTEAPVTEPASLVLESNHPPTAREEISPDAVAKANKFGLSDNDNPPNEIGVVKCANPSCSLTESDYLQLIYVCPYCKPPVIAKYCSQFCKSKHFTAHRTEQCGKNKPAT